MKEIDLNKYKEAWKSGQSFEIKSLTDDDINALLKKKSKDISNLFSKTLAIDIIIKSIIAISFLHLSLLYLENPKAFSLLILLFTCTIGAIVFLMRIKKLIPDIDYSKENLKAVLESKINYYTKKYFKSHSVVALTNPMLLLSGSLYYFYYKYGIIPHQSIADYLVLSVFIAAGFIIGVLIQIKYHKFHIQQLKHCLTEIDDNTINDEYIKAQNKRRLQIMLFSILSIIIGLSVLIFFYFL